MKTEQYSDPASFAAAVRRAQRAATRNRRPDDRPRLPRAAAAAPTGLTRLLAAGWSVRYAVGRGYRMTRGALDTGYHMSELAMCRAAKELEIRA